MLANLRAERKERIPQDGQQAPANPARRLMLFAVVIPVKGKPEVIHAKVDKGKQKAVEPSMNARSLARQQGWFDDGQYELIHPAQSLDEATSLERANKASGIDSKQLQDRLYELVKAIESHAASALPKAIQQNVIPQTLSQAALAPRPRIRTRPPCRTGGMFTPPNEGQANDESELSDLDESLFAHFPDILPIARPRKKKGRVAGTNTACGSSKDAKPPREA